MIQLEKHGLILIKTQRTASTAVATAMNLHAKETDIVAELETPVYFYRARNSEGYTEWTIARDIPKQLRKTHKLFCIEREPVSKCISHYSWLVDKNRPITQRLQMTWTQYINSTLLPIDHFRYTDDNNKLIVDKIIKYENLHEELSEYLPIKLDKKIINRQSNMIEFEVDDKLREFIYDKFSESNRHTGYAL